MSDKRYNKGYYHSEYIEGNAVRKLQPEIKVANPKKKVNKHVQRNRAKAKGMNVGYVLYLSAMLCAVVFILVQYIGLQSDLTNCVTTISSMEQELNDLTLANDEEESRINSRMDLEEIRNIAIAELGMTYAKEGQMESFSSEDSDYVRQVADIPQN